MYLYIYIIYMCVCVYLLKALWGGQHRRLLFTIGNRVEVTGKHGMLIKIGQLMMTV